MTLAEIRSGWDQAARENAMGNIVSSRQDWDPDEFFAYGQAEIDQVMDRLAGLGLRNGSDRALDFGCGIGRLTQALAEHYDRVIGVDVSPVMLRQAREHNRHGERVTYAQNGKRLKFDDGSFDLVYSMIVLQHMPQRLQEGYVREFVRVLKLSGAAVFQVPECPDYGHITPWLSMFGTPRGEVERWVAEAGGEVVDFDEENGCRYTAVHA